MITAELCTSYWSYGLVRTYPAVSEKFITFMERLPVPSLLAIKASAVLLKVMKKNKRERDEDDVRHGDQYDTQLLWFLMRHMRNRRPPRVSPGPLASNSPSVQNL